MSERLQRMLASAAVQLGLSYAASLAEAHEPAEGGGPVLAMAFETPGVYGACCAGAGFGFGRGLEGATGGEAARLRKLAAETFDEIANLHFEQREGDGFIAY